MVCCHGSHNYRLSASRGQVEKGRFCSCFVRFCRFLPAAERLPAASLRQGGDWRAALWGHWESLAARRPSCFPPRRSAVAGASSSGRGNGTEPGATMPWPRHVADLGHGPGGAPPDISGRDLTSLAAPYMHSSLGGVAASRPSSGRSARIPRLCTHRHRPMGSGTGPSSSGRKLGGWGLPASCPLWAHRGLAVRRRRGRSCSGCDR